MSEIKLSLKTYCKHFGGDFTKVKLNHGYYYHMHHLGCVISPNKLLANGKDKKMSLNKPTSLTTSDIKFSVDKIKNLIENNLCGKSVYTISKNQLITKILTLNEFIIELDYKDNNLCFNIYCPQLIEGSSCGFRIAMNKEDSMEKFLEKIKKYIFFNKEKMLDKVII